MQILRKPVAALLLYLGLATFLYAHAILLSSVPGTQQVLRGPDVSLRLRFNSRIDGKRSRFVLISKDGFQAVLDIQGQDSADTLTAQAKGLKAGSYVLRWQVLAMDGHITRGEIPFQVQ